MNLIVQVPSSFLPERTWILETLLSDFLGLNFEIQEGQEGATRFFIKNDSKELIINDHFFALWDASNSWKEKISYQDVALPDELPLEVPMLKKLKLLFGNQPSITFTSERIEFNIDLLGNSFFLLSRFEELSYKDQKFPFKGSVAHQGQFIFRPLVNEYLEALWAGLKKCWPWLKRKERSFKVHVSHDVDVPYLFYQRPFPINLKTLMAPALKEKSLRRSLEVSHKYVSYRLKGKERDPYNTYAWLMDQQEKRNLQSTFYFLSIRPENCAPWDYQLNRHEIKNELGHIFKRGHRLGLHASDHTFLKNDELEWEYQNFQKVCKSQQVRPEPACNRFHTLKLNAQTSLEDLEKCGIQEDSSIGHSETIGFRSSICYSYRPFSFAQRRGLRLWELPLMVMDVSLYASRYMGLKTMDLALPAALQVKETCRIYKGDFTLLWHNSSLDSSFKRELFLKILEG